MNCFKRVLPSAILLLTTNLMVAQQYRTTVMYTTGNGSSTNSDRDQAKSDATDTATNWANSQCIGNVTETNITYQQCTPIGSGDNQQYMCAVTVKAKCEIQSRVR
jgi:hypothetical protein